MQQIEVVGGQEAETKKWTHPGVVRSHLQRDQ